MEKLSRKIKVRLIIVIVVAIVITLEEFLRSRMIVSWGYRILPFVICGLVITIILLSKKGKGLIFFMVILSFIINTSLNLINYFVLPSEYELLVDVFPIDYYHYKIVRGTGNPRVYFKFKGQSELFVVYEKNMEDKKYVGMKYYEGIISGYIIKERRLLTEEESNIWGQSSIFLH